MINIERINGIIDELESAGILYLFEIRKQALYKMENKNIYVEYFRFLFFSLCSMIFFPKIFSFAF